MSMQYINCDCGQPGVQFGSGLSGHVSLRTTEIDISNLKAAISEGTDFLYICSDPLHN